MLLLDVLGIHTGINRVLLWIDTTVYRFVGFLYELFLYLATESIFSQDSYNELVSRIYLILGLVMLFILSYTLLKMIIEPDGEAQKSAGKIIFNTVKALALVIVMPLIFKYVHGAQSAIFKQGTIPKLILGTKEEADLTKEEGIANQGAEISAMVFTAFFRVNPTYCLKELQIDAPKLSFEDRDLCEEQVLSYDEYPFAIPKDALGATEENSDDTQEKTQEEVQEETNPFSNIYVSPGPATLGSAWGIAFFKAAEREGLVSARNTVYQRVNFQNARLNAKFNDIGVFKAFAKNVTEEEVIYSFPFSLIAGGFLVYVMFVFCFDLGVRVAKLALLQVIAPIPIFASILPGSESIFKNWVKKTSATFMEAFVRMISMFFGIFLISMFQEKLLSTYKENPSFVSLLAQVFVTLGILAMVKEIPKLLSELFPNMNAGSMSLGLKDKFGFQALKRTALTAGGLGGAAITAGIRNFNKAREENEGGGLKGAIKTARSTIAGAVSGGVRGGYRGFRARMKSFSDLKKETSGAINKAEEKRDERAFYKANPGLRMQKLGRKLSDYAHGPGDVEALSKKKKTFEEVEGATKYLRDISSGEDKYFKTLMTQAAELRATKIERTEQVFDQAGYSQAQNAAESSAISTFNGEMQKIVSDFKNKTLSKDEYDSKYKDLLDKFEKNKEQARENVNKNDFVRTMERSASDIAGEIAKIEQQANELENLAKARSGQVMNAFAEAASAAKGKDKDDKLAVLVRDYGFSLDKATAITSKFSNAVSEVNATTRDALLNYGELRDSGITELDLTSSTFSQDLKKRSDIMTEEVLPAVNREISEATRR